MLLVVGRAGHHIAHKEAFGRFQARILQSGKNGFTSQDAQGLVPVLACRGLADTEYGYFSHKQHLEERSTAKIKNKGRKGKRERTCFAPRAVGFFVL
jgi:hypothetical protein